VAQAREADPLPGDGEGGDQAYLGRDVRLARDEGEAGLQR
jgi:hypothetical protein